MATVTIGSYDTKLGLTCVERDDSGTPLTLVATLDGPGLSASVSAYDDRYEALTAFFQGLADSWRGWEGDRCFSSLEGELDITARHDGHIRLSIRLGRVDDPGHWTVQAEVTVDPGEDIASAARDVGSLISQT